MSSGPRIGTQFAGYHIEALLGRGGMSVVYRAENPRLGNQVALKLLAPELTEDEAFRERFVRESRLAASINHANVLPIYDAGAFESVLYIAMKYVAGWDLRMVIRQRGPLAPEVAVEIVGQVARGLDAAHRQDLVHRDVKPANILIERGRDDGLGHVYLADFGLMKHSLSHSGLTNTGSFMGTVSYIAPEQIANSNVDRRSDIYSLGCVLYEALTGEAPFLRDTDWAVLNAHMNEQPTPPGAVKPGIPATLDRVVMRAMAKAPDDRYPTAGDLAAAAADALRSPARPAAEETVAWIPPAVLAETQASDPAPTPVAAGADPTRESQPPAPPTAPPAPTVHASAPPPGRGSNRIAWAIGLIAVLAIGVAGGQYLGNHNSTDSARSSQSTPTSSDPGTGLSGDAKTLQRAVFGGITNPANQRDCSAPAQGANGVWTMTCTNPASGVQSAVFTLYKPPMPGMNHGEWPVYRRYLSDYYHLQQHVQLMRASAQATGDSLGLNTGPCERLTYKEDAWSHEGHQLALPLEKTQNPGGRVMCWLDPHTGAAKIEWTSDGGEMAGSILANATGDNHGTLAAWWSGVKHHITTMAMSS